MEFNRTLGDWLRFFLIRQDLTKLIFESITERTERTLILPRQYDEFGGIQPQGDALDEDVDQSQGGNFKNKLTTKQLFEQEYNCSDNCLSSKTIIITIQLFHQEYNCFIIDIIV